MSNSNFSIVVVLYRSVHHLPRLLENICKILPMVNDIILVNNSREELSGIANEHVRIIQPKKNLGYGGAINCGVAAATNENLILANPDINFKEFNFTPDLLANDSFIVSGKTPEMTSLPVFPRPGWDLIRIGLCNIGWFFGYLRRLFPKHPLEYNEGFAPADWVPGCLLVTNKKSMTALGGFDEKYFLFYEEVDLCHRASDSGITIGIFDGIKYINFHGTSSITNVSKIKMKAEVESLIRYHTKFNPGLWSKFCVITLKLWCGCVGTILQTATFLSPNNKPSAKAKQYLLYYQSLRVGKTTEARK